MDVDPVVRAQFERHLAQFFTHHPRETKTLGHGPIETRLRGFHVEVFQPGPRQPACWTYVTCGAGSIVVAPDHRVEFFLMGLRPDERWLELLTMTAYYHAGPDSQRYGQGHTVPIGEPLVPGSTCDHLLFCLPYTYGPELERCDLDDATHIQVLWALPITAKERAFKVEHGLEALEERFERAGLEYWDTARKSVI